MEIFPIDSNLENLVFEDEEDLLREEESEENIEPNFYSENENQELQLNDRKNEEEFNLALSYKFDDFQCFNINPSGNGKEKNVFISRKKNRVKIKNDVVKKIKTNFLKVTAQRLKDELINKNVNNNDKFLNIINNEKSEGQKSKYLNNLINESINYKENENIEVNNNFAKRETKNYINNNINNKKNYINYFNKQKNTFNNNLTMEVNGPLIISPSKFSHYNLEPLEYISNSINNFKGTNNMTIDDSF